MIPTWIHGGDDSQYLLVCFFRVILTCADHSFNLKDELFQTSGTKPKELSRLRSQSNEFDSTFERNQQPKTLIPHHVLFTFLYPPSKHWNLDLHHSSCAFSSFMVNRYLFDGLWCHHPFVFQIVLIMVWLLHCTLLRSLVMFHMWIFVCASLHQARDWESKIQLFRAVSMDLCFFDCNSCFDFVRELLYQICILDLEFHKMMLIWIGLGGDKAWD